MARFKNTKGMVILLLFLVPALANAATTMNCLNRDYIVNALPAGLDSYAYCTPDIDQITGLYNSRLAAIAVEFNKPPVNFEGSPIPAYADTIKSLPPVPGTLLMVLVGFLCVSLVKDRRVWLAALAGLLWAGQAGFAVLPQLALQMASKKQSEQQSSPDVARLCEPDYPCRLRSDIEGTSYIGLLRRLAGMPDATVSFLPRIAVRDKLQQESKKIITQFCRRPGYSNTSTRSLCHFKAISLFEGNSYQINHYFGKGPHFAIMGLLSCLIRSTDCLAPRAEQPVYLSTAFIFANLARGPPSLTRIDNLLNWRINAQNPSSS
ncbi:MAG: hypothetical protein ACYS80_09180 [Planctomycetota bacterium]|jgi:hypothetical protein